ncbi:MAG: thioesterase [Marinilabilia sp.]
MSVRQENLTISTLDAGVSGQLKTIALMHHLQELAARHVTHLKVGFEELRKDNIFWDLTHLQIEIIRWPFNEKKQI